MYQVTLIDRDVSEHLLSLSINTVDFSPWSDKMKATQSLGTQKNVKQSLLVLLDPIVPLYKAFSSSLSHRSHQVFSEEGTKALHGDTCKLLQPQLVCDIKLHSTDTFC